MCSLAKTQASRASFRKPRGNIADRPAPPGTHDSSGRRADIEPTRHLRRESLVKRDILHVSEITDGLNDPCAAHNHVQAGVRFADPVESFAD